MYKGFDGPAFMAYLENTFNGFENCFLREIVLNIIEYAHNHEHVSKDQFIYFLFDLLPGLDFGEIAQFANDEILTEYGKAEKQKHIQTH